MSANAVRISILLCAGIFSSQRALSVDETRLEEKIKFFEASLKVSGVDPKSFASSRLESETAATGRLLPPLLKQFHALEDELSYLRTDACPSENVKPKTIAEEFVGMSFGVDIRHLRKNKTAVERKKLLSLYGHFHCPKVELVRPTNPPSRVNVTDAMSTHKAFYPLESSTTAFPAWLAAWTRLESITSVRYLYGSDVSKELDSLVTECEKLGISSSELAKRIYGAVYSTPPPGPDLRLALKDLPAGFQKKIKDFLRKF